MNTGTDEISASAVVTFSEGTNASDLASPTKVYGGMQRSGYFLGMLGMLALDACVSRATEGEPVAGLTMLTVTFVVSIPLTVKRLQNIGMNPWNVLWGLVPIVSTVLAVRCLMMPEGYQDTRKLDDAGKAILAVMLSLVGVGVLLLVLALAQ